MRVLALTKGETGLNIIKLTQGPGHGVQGKAQLFSYVKKGFLFKT